MKNKQEGRKLVVKIEYPGSIISVNHYKYKYYTKPEAKAWMELLGWQVKGAHIEDWKLPLKIIVNGEFKDHRSCPDLHNLLKVICDAIEEVTDLNDRDFKTETGEPVITGTSKPQLFITIQEKLKELV